MAPKRSAADMSWALGMEEVEDGEEALLVLNEAFRR